MTGIETVKFMTNALEELRRLIDAVESYKQVLPSRSISLAATKLEEAEMWLHKAYNTTK